MNDTLEQSLREIYAEDAASYDTTAAIGRLRASAYRPRASRRNLWGVVGASSAALAAGIVAAILLLSSGTTAAYAGWTSVPSAPTAAALAAAITECNDVQASSSSTYRFTGQPVLTEARDVYTAAIYLTGGLVYGCLYTDGTVGAGGDEIFSRVTDVSQFGPVDAAPAADRLTIPYRARISGGSATPARPLRDYSPAEIAGGSNDVSAGYGNYVLGQAGSDISAVTFAFDNQEPVEATVENGWYFAWWPWIGTPTSVTVTTSSGTVTSSLSSSSKGAKPEIVPACQPGAGGCVFGATTLAVPTATFGP